MNNMITKEFEGKLVQMIEKDGEVLFELYSTGMALGYANKRNNSQGVLYISPYKSRIDKIVKNAGIMLTKQDSKKYISLTDLRKLISISQTKNKTEFIAWLKNIGLIDKKEVFGTIRKEQIFLNSLEKILKHMDYTLEQQKIDGKYRFDGYIKELDMVIEYDEDGHRNYDLNKEKEREDYIKENYSYLLRLTDFNDLMNNIGIVMKKITEVM